MARNKYPEETVARILDAAQRLFLEKGYDQTTIQDIVDQLGGLTKGAVYHHFKSKEEILDAVGDRMFLQNNPFEAVRRRTGAHHPRPSARSIGPHQLRQRQAPSPAEKSSGGGGPRHAEAGCKGEQRR